MSSTKAKEKCINYFLQLTCPKQFKYYVHLVDGKISSRDTYSNYALLCHDDCFEIVGITINDQTSNIRDKDWPWRMYLKADQLQYVRKLFKQNIVNQNKSYTITLNTIKKEKYSDKFNQLLQFVERVYYERYGIGIEQDLSELERSVDRYYQEQIKKYCLQNISFQDLYRTFDEDKQTVRKVDKRKVGCQTRTISQARYENYLHQSFAYGSHGANSYLADSIIYQDHE